MTTTTTTKPETTPAGASTASDKAGVHASTSAPGTKESEIDPVVETEKARNERPSGGLDHRPSRLQRMRPLTHAAGPQPEEVEAEMAKTKHETGDSREEAELQVRAEREAKERQKKVEKMQAGLKKKKETEDEIRKEIDARQEELKEKKKQKELDKTEATTKPQQIAASPPGSPVPPGAKA